MPKPGETFGWFQRELHRIKSLLVEQNLKIARTARDVELAVNGEPHVVLAVEGANFIEGDIGRVKVAYDLGVRHLQLVHYSRNTLGDYQTIEPEHGGLTDLGKKVVQECNRLGILIDLAHSTSNSVAQALSLSRVPIVWSHSSVTSGEPHWSMIGWKARQLRLSDAKAIASKGGVVGLWALRQDMGRSLEGYADRLSALATQLGDSHVAFGSDMNGLGRSALVNEFSDLRTVVDHWRTQRHELRAIAQIGDRQLRARAARNDRLTPQRTRGLFLHGALAKDLELVLAEIVHPPVLVAVGQVQAKISRDGPRIAAGHLVDFRRLEIWPIFADEFERRFGTFKHQSREERLTLCR